MSFRYDKLCAFLKKRFKVILWLLVIHKGTASEAMLVGLLAARSKTLKRLKAENSQEDEKILASRFVAYSSGLRYSTLTAFYPFFHEKKYPSV